MKSPGIVNVTTPYRSGGDQGQRWAAGIDNGFEQSIPVHGSSLDDQDAAAGAGLFITDGADKRGGGPARAAVCQWFRL